MRQFEQDWLELGRRVACSLHHQHPRNLRLLQAVQTELAAESLRNGNPVIDVGWLRQRIWIGCWSQRRPPWRSWPRSRGQACAGRWQPQVLYPPRPPG
jgi:hypothetical protein